MSSRGFEKQTHLGWHLHDAQVIRMGADNMVTIMERAIEAGHSVLIENMGESIDAVLNPVITR
jgi:dynein heavy chain